MEDSHWKNKFQNIYKNCQEELKKTTEIGKKMLSASKTNSCLHDSFEELGMLALKEIKSGNLEWDNPKVLKLIKQIESCEKDLSLIENEVNKIKFSSAPVDVNKQPKNND